MNFLEIKSWKDRKEIIHGFGTRNNEAGRVTRPDWKSGGVDLDGERVPLVSLRQVHGDTIRVFQGGEKETGDLWEREGDALITSSSGVALGIFTADCLPIFLFEPEKQVVAAVHAGWRGTARGISRKAVEKMAEVFACAKEKILAALGPCIGPCCYEVDEPVEAKFHDSGLPWESFAFLRGPGRWSLDLQEANLHLLIKSGVKRENIRRLALCTSCRSDLFFSHRREKGTRGRHLNFISMLKISNR
jgi:hypothetical protein